MRVELTTNDAATTFVGKRVLYGKPEWHHRRPGECLRTEGRFLVIRNAADVEIRLPIRASDPWDVEEAEAP